jgi:tRNA(Ile)-lysidine synthase
MASGESSFSGTGLLDSLNRLPTPVKYWVGFSGGADSTALLLALHECRDHLPAPIHAVHFNHGLQDQADHWRASCQAFCDARDIPFLSETLSILKQPRKSLEAEARDSRYRAVARILGENEMYLTAHHAEDQAETLFLNLMRGSGIEGLAGIPVSRNLGNGWVARPLLDVHRHELEAFLNKREITWLEDPSNSDTAFDRNYLRHKLFPRLEQRWPGLSTRLSRTARNARSSAGALAHFIEGQSGELLGDPMRMSVSKLFEFDVEMQALILRQWLRRHEVPVLPESRMRELLDQLANGQPESQPEVQWGDWLLKRYRHELWLHRRGPFTGCENKSWHKGMKIDLGPESGQYRLVGKEAAIPEGWRVGSREEGGRIRPVEANPSRKIKHYFQTASVPPWLRLGIPVLYWDDEPVALGDWAFGHRLWQWLVENGLELEWKPADPVLARVRKDCQD